MWVYLGWHGGMTIIQVSVEVSAMALRQVSLLIVFSDVIFSDNFV